MDMFGKEQYQELELYFFTYIIVTVCYKTIYRAARHRALLYQTHNQLTKFLRNA